MCFSLLLGSAMSEAKESFFPLLSRPLMPCIHYVFLFFISCLNIYPLTWKLKISSHFRTGYTGLFTWADYFYWVFLILWSLVEMESGLTVRVGILLHFQFSLPL